MGVTEYITAHGSVDWSIDIYHRWPGFFAFGAFLSWITGTATPESYVGWFEVVFPLVHGVLVAGIGTALTGRRRIGWAAATIFVTANWVGQEYYSPQTFTYTLALAIFWIAVRHLGDSRPTPIGRLAERWAGRLVRRPVTAASRIDGGRWPRAWAITVLLVLFAVVVVSHQLSPFMIILTVTALVLLGRIRPWWLPLALGAVAAAYLVFHFGYIQERYGIFSGLNPFKNAAHLATYDVSPVLGKRINGWAGRALTAFLLLGCAGLVWVARRMDLRLAVGLAVAAFSPFALLFGQGYGGEGILRVILFWLPWASIAVALLVAREPVPTRRRAPAGVAAGLVLLLSAALFVPAWLGSAELSLVSRSEAQAMAWFYRNAAPGSVLVAAAPGTPLRGAPNYYEFRGPKSDDDPNLLRTEVMRYRALGSPEDVDQIKYIINNYSANGYVIFAPILTRYAHVFQLTPDGALADLERAVAASPQFKRIYADGGVTIYELVTS